ncbi:MAG: A/G-specific DNA-adenine glycosylase [Ferruginibacter sp.]|nr:A/G-specific DNA-adenine glycosylase [Ferruginibacter sp.]
MAFPNQKFFAKALIQWDKSQNQREMPWKAEPDPYKIWLSEIILQQTRVDQGWEYYTRFIAKYPNIKQLAAAPDAEVFKLWEGLGYYSRCKNLIATAKKISQEYNGQFPGAYDDILALKGIGPYTAAAIASFGFNLPYAVVDGNVSRVLSRFFAIASPIDSTVGKKQFAGLAQDLLDLRDPGGYNQAIMDFGATICKPAIPLCDACVLQKKCLAYQQDKVKVLPVKEKKMIRRERWFYYLVFQAGNKMLIHKRESKDIWQNLHEPFLLEQLEKLSADQLLMQQEFRLVAGKHFKILSISKSYRQLLTHQTIRAQFIRMEVPEKFNIEGFEWLDKTEMAKLAFPRLINDYLLENKTGN